MNTGEMSAQRRLSVLELAAQLGNVAEACRQSGTDRTRFYEWKRRYQDRGFDGLRDIQPHVNSDLAKIAAAMRTRICTLALAHAANTSNRIASILALEGAHITLSAIQKILDAEHIGTELERCRWLEQQYRDGPQTLSADQLSLIERVNPCFRERNAESARPGARLAQAVLFAGTIRNADRLHMHLVIDTLAAFAFGFFHTSRQPEAAVAVLHNEVLPFYRRAGLPVLTIVTNNAREFSAGNAHPYSLYLALNGIAHQRPGARAARTNGFLVRFAETFRDEFLNAGAPPFADLPGAQEALANWLTHYNEKRPHDGYPNFGLTPKAFLFPAP